MAVSERTAFILKVAGLAPHMTGRAEDARLALNGLVEEAREIAHNHYLWQEAADDAEFSCEYCEEFSTDDLDAMTAHFDTCKALLKAYPDVAVAASEPVCGYCREWGHAASDCPNAPAE